MWVAVYVKCKYKHIFKYMYIHIHVYLDYQFVTVVTFRDKDLGGGKLIWRFIFCLFLFKLYNNDHFIFVRSQSNRIIKLPKLRFYPSHGYWCNLPHLVNPQWRYILDIETFFLHQFPQRFIFWFWPFCFSLYQTFLFQFQVFYLRQLYLFMSSWIHWLIHFH